MSTKEMMLYRVKARGLFVKKHNENVSNIKLESKDSDNISFSVTGVKNKETITMKLAKA